MMNHSKTENPKRTTAKHRPVGNDKYDTRSEEPDKKCDDRQGPDFVGINIGCARCPLREHKGKQHTKRRESAVGWNDDRADVKEDWMHLSKDSLSG